VFLRRERDHKGPLTDLLWSPHEVKAAAAALCDGGERMTDLIAVEFCSTVDDAGYYTRYRAWIVGQRIIPFSMRVSRQWMVKRETATTPTEWQRAKEAAYLHNCPHEDWLRRVFAIARVEFGAADYSIDGDGARVWEVNSNPDGFSGSAPSRVPGQRELFASRFTAALRAIDASVQTDASASSAATPVWKHVERLQALVEEQRLRGDRLVEAADAQKVRADREQTKKEVWRQAAAKHKARAEREEAKKQTWRNAAASEKAKRAQLEANVQTELPSGEWRPEQLESRELTPTDNLAEVDANRGQQVARGLARLGRLARVRLRGSRDSTQVPRKSE
jgi:hypothetical protein